MGLDPGKPAALCQPLTRATGLFFTWSDRSSPFLRHCNMDGYINYTLGAGGRWIAWHTETKPAKNATGRDLAASPGAVQFAIGTSPEAAFAKLQLEMSPQSSGSQTPKKGKST